MLQFRDLTLADKPAFDACAAKFPYHTSEYCFTDLFIWSGHYRTTFCFYHGFFLTRCVDENGHAAYLAPIGDGDLANIIDVMMVDAASQGEPFTMFGILPDMIERIEQAKPGLFTFSHENEDGDDYIYLSEKLQTLSGKKLQSKRNLINRFRAEHEGHWQFEEITTENLEIALAFHLHWCELNGCAMEQSFRDETCAIQRGLANWTALGLVGGMLKLDGEVIAFSFGCRAFDDMMVVQIEKADHTIPGAYQMINQQFVLHFGQSYTYINREEDLGLEGLRKAKSSYYPAMRAVKHTAVLKEQMT